MIAVRDDICIRIVLKKGGVAPVMAEAAGRISSLVRVK